MMIPRSLKVSKTRKVDIRCSYIYIIKYDNFYHFVLLLLFRERERERERERVHTLYIYGIYREQSTFLYTFIDTEHYFSRTSFLLLYCFVLAPCRKALLSNTAFAIYRIDTLAGVRVTCWCVYKHVSGNPVPTLSTIIWWLEERS
jgi:hypothetical protein